MKDTEFLPAFPVWQTAIPGQTGKTDRKGLKRRKRNNEETIGDRRKHPYTEKCDIVYPVKCGGQRPEERKTASPVFAYWEGKTGRVEDRVKKKESGSEKPCGSEREALEHEEGSGTTGFEGSMQGEREQSGQAECEAGSGNAAPAVESAQKHSTRQKLEQTGQAECEAGCRDAVPAGEPAQKRSTRRKLEQSGQAEREPGCRGSPPAVADAEEVLAALTRILRGEEEAKTSEVLRAAELLGRQYGLFGDREGAPAEPPKIVMDVPGREEKQ